MFASEGLRATLVQDPKAPRRGQGVTLNVPGSPPSRLQAALLFLPAPAPGQAGQGGAGGSPGPRAGGQDQVGVAASPPTPARVPQSRAMSLGLPGEAGPALLSLGGLAPEADPWGCGSINSCPGLIRSRFCLRCTWKPRLVDTGLSLRVRL